VRDLGLAQTMTEHAETALVRGLAARTPEACAALYDRFALGVHRYAVARLRGEVGLAEDSVALTTWERRWLA
jgi:hypothetical protein